MEQDIYYLQFIAVASGGYKTAFNLSVIATQFFYFSVKSYPANVLAHLLINIVSISLFDRCDRDKPKKINILLLSGMAD